MWLIVGVLVAGGLYAVLAAAFQAAGGALLERVQSVTSGDLAVDVPCSYPTRTGGEQIRDLDEARRWLQMASTLAPFSAQNYLLLGETYCLSGKTAPALESLRQYTARRPNNPLGHQELCALYFKTWNETGAVDLASFSRTDAGQQMLQECRQGGVRPAASLQRADQEYALGHYARSAQLYAIARLLGADVAADQAFRFGIAAILAGKPLPAEAPDTRLPVHVLGKQTLTLTGAQFQWLGLAQQTNYSDGSFITDRPDSSSGVMWTEGAAGVALRVDQAGKYRFSLQVQHNPGSSQDGQVNLLLDMRPVGQYRLTPQAQEISCLLDLPAGAHVLGIQYVADVGDVIIQQASIAPQE